MAEHWDKWSKASMKVNSIAFFPTLLSLAFGEARTWTQASWSNVVPYPPDPLLSLSSAFSPSAVHFCVLTQPLATSLRIWKIASKWAFKSHLVLHPALILLHLSLPLLSRFFSPGASHPFPFLSSHCSFSFFSPVLLHCFFSFLSLSQ